MRRILVMSGSVVFYALLFFHDMNFSEHYPLLLFYLIPFFIFIWKKDGQYLTPLSVLITVLLVAGMFFPEFKADNYLMHTQRLLEISILWFFYLTLKQRVSAQKELHKKNALLENILNHTHISIAYMDKEFNFIKVNKAYAKADEKEPSFFEGKNHFQLYPDKENEEIFRNVVNTGKPYFVSAKSFQYSDKHERGISYWNWSLVPTFDSSNNIDGLLLSLSDVTKEVKITEEFKVQEALLKTILDHLPVGVWVADKTGKITYGNQAGREIWRGVKYVGVDEFHEYKAWWLDSGELLAPEDWAVARAVRNKETSLNEKLLIRCFDGSYKKIINSAVPYYLEDSSLAGAIIVNQDITELIDNQEKLKKTLINLERSNRDLEQFAYICSHDLQEPLRMISIYTKMLENRYHETFDHKGKEFMNFVIEGARRMQLLISELLSYSIISTKKQLVEEVDCSEIIKRVLTDISVRVAENNATVIFNDLPVIRANPVLISQLFQNLITNAIKFRSEDNPKIIISCEIGKSEWVFSVKDNGIGIDPEYFDRIFIIFQRLHTRENYPGTGIGLTICKKIVEQHGGRIWIESKEGFGSTFFFSISRELE